MRAERRRTPRRGDVEPPKRAADDHGVPYQVALAAQELLDQLIGDEPFDLAEAAPVMARLAAFTADGHHPERTVWTKARVLARAAELVHEYQVPPELGGDLPPVPEPGDVEELVGTRT